MSNQQEENLIQIIFQKYLPYWPLLIASIILFMLGGYLFLTYTTPIYKATATIIIKDEKKGNDDSKLIESLNTMNSKKIIENEMEVLKSRKIINEVATTNYLNTTFYIKGKIRNIDAYNYTPVNIIIDNPDKIKEIKNIKLNINYRDSSVVLNNEKVGKINHWINTKYGKLNFLLKEDWKSLQNDRDIYFNIEKTENIATQIIKNLETSSSNKLSSIIEISYKDEVKERAENILNSILKAYDDYGINNKNSAASNTLEFIEQRLKIVSREIDSIENTVEDFKRNKNADDIGTQGQLFLNNVSSNDQELGKINMQLAILQQVTNVVNEDNMNSISMIPSSLGIDNPNLSKMISDLNNKELEFESLKKTVAKNNPILISVKDQIDKLKPSILMNLNSQINNLETGKNNLLKTNNKYNELLSVLPQKEKTLLSMTRGQDIMKGIYSFLLQKKEETKLSFAANVSDNKIINDAMVSKYPVYPIKLYVYFIALMLSIFIFWIIIFFKEAFRKKINEKKTIEDLLELSIIGEITYKNKNESQIIEQNKRSLIAEEFRKIRIGLNFLGVNKLKNKILITSSIPGEGKSFVAINLAISNAMTGKKVLLIDCDLHKSGLEEIFKLNTQYLGMSEFLMGECDMNEIISKVEWQDNLFFIPAGKNKINGSELLLNKRLKEMISELENDFDLILIDSAPSILITDAFILSEICDCTLFIVRHQFTTKNTMKKMSEILKINPLKNVGIVFNGIKRNKCLPINNEYTKYYMNEIKEDENKRLLTIRNN